MGLLDDLGQKASDLFSAGKDKVEGMMHGDQAEGAAGGIADKAAGAADSATGGKFTDQINGVRDSIDGNSGGNSGDAAPQQ